MRAILLGSGTSTGVPVIACRCSVCTGGHPRNQRSRASVAVQQGGETILIDTSPELRLQLLASDIRSLRAVLYTHLHADHVHGFDDLRAFYFGNRQALDVYLLPELIPELKMRFAYAFEKTGYDGAIPQVTLHPIPDGPFRIGSFEVDPVRLPHGHVTSCGFRFGNFAYATDFKAFPPESILKWRGKLDAMIASGIHFGKHSSHSVIPETIQLFQELMVKFGVISHLAHNIDYPVHSELMPPGIVLGFDGMTIDLEPTVS
jgi:phosphoribosyl 1,2-cyclic phosphate phosphodiesterase